jgi:anti-anti-sigma regulatory factor
MNVTRNKENELTISPLLANLPPRNMLLDLQEVTFEDSWRALNIEAI